MRSRHRQEVEGQQPHRPEPVGGYKVLDGGLLHGMSGRIVDLVAQRRGTTWIMDLYLVPHGRVVMQAVQTLRHLPERSEIITIGEAVGSDITDVVRNALAADEPGAAALVLANYLDHDRPVAVSQYTIDCIIEAGAEVDERLGTNFATQLRERVRVSYPAIDAALYTAIERQPTQLERNLLKRDLIPDNFLFFLSRLAPAKGADDLIHGYRASSFYGRMPLVIAGNGPALEDLQRLAGDDPNIRILTDVGDEEKPWLMHGCRAYVLPSKPRTEFVETFGIAVAEKMLAGGAGLVLTTETGGIPEATGGHCLTIEADNPASITAQLEVLANMSVTERRARALKAQAYAMQFDRAAVFDRLTGPNLVNEAA